jgi:hypothetical protein
MSEAKQQQPVSAPPTPGPAITSANLPTPPVAPKVSVEEPIVAKPLVDADFTKLKAKNPLMSIYFGNRIANNGMRIEDLKSRGFRIASPDEVVTFDGKPCPAGLIQNGHVQRGDLLLLIIPKKDYIGQLKYNEQQAYQRVSKAANAARGRDELGNALKEVGGLPPRYRGKIAVYQPNPGDLDQS